MLTEEVFNRFVKRVRYTDGCWIWTGNRNGDGYGVFHVSRTKRYMAHRAALEFANGEPVPSDKLACHHCDNPSCVRPSHLYIGTFSDNNSDTYYRGPHPFRSYKRPFLTHCHQGHLFTPDSVYIDRSTGKRKCKICACANYRKRWHLHWRKGR